MRSAKRAWERRHPGEVWPGYFVTPEVRSHLIECKLGQNNHNYGKPANNKGKPISQVTRDLLSLRGKGRAAPNKGKPGYMLGRFHTAATKELMSKAM